MTKKRKDSLLKTLHLYKLCGFKYHKELSFFENSSLQKGYLPDDIVTLQEHVKNCVLCELSNQREKTPILGVGNVSSEVYIVGTDFQFLQKALNDILKNIVQNVLMLDFKKVYMTTIVKCEVSNSSNLQNSVDFCKDYLVKQIQINKPKYIITLGDSFNYIMNSDKQISDIAGNSYDFMDAKLIPILDLGFIYKNPSYKYEMYKALQKVKMIMDIK